MVNAAYRYRMYPTPEQEQMLTRTFGCVRVVYNHILAERQRLFYKEKTRTTYGDASKMLTGLKKKPEFSWLNEVSSVPLQQSLRHQQGAYRNFFEKRAQYPKFKSRRNKQSAEFTKSAFSWDGSALKLAKMSEPLNIVWHRELPGEPTTVTITKDPDGRWFVSIAIEFEPKLGPKPKNAEVGVDLGITDTVIISNGWKSGPAKISDKNKTRLLKVERKLAKKQKGSRNREKARIKVARAHSKIADARKDRLHKLSRKIVDENQVICMEDLSIKSMLESGSRSLSRELSNASLGELSRMIEYKAEWSGRQVVKINRFYPSSKRCSDCGFVVESLDLSVRSWTCKCCGSNHDRDINAALNIKAAGLAVLVCGDDVRRDSPSGSAAIVSEAENSSE